MIYTIGHSTRSEKEFIDLLKKHSIDTLIDIRMMPRSRWNPQYNKAALQKSISASGMEYQHMSEVGGLRKPTSSIVNTAWKNPAFRGYADYMQTANFEEALLKIIASGGKKNIALMCAEAHYDKCHRKLLSDALTARNVEVLHIIDVDQVKKHELTPFAKVRGKKITYPAINRVWNSRYDSCCDQSIVRYGL